MNIRGWSDNNGGDKNLCSRYKLAFGFGPDVLSRFCGRHELDLVVRAGKPVEDGYELFPDDNWQLVTIFGTPNFKGKINKAAIMSVDESLLCSFQVRILHLDGSDLTKYSKNPSSPTPKI